MEKKMSTNIFKFRSEKTQNLFDGIHKTERVISELPSQENWSKVFPEGPTREKAIDILESNRNDLYDAIKREAENGFSLESRPPYPAYRINSKQPKFSRGLKGMFADSSCCDVEINVEELYIPPIGVEYDSFATPDGCGDGLLLTPAPQYKTYCDYIMWVNDNNDPFNNDTSCMLLGVRYIYELPSRPFKASYEMSVYGRMDLDVETRSNNVFGKHFSRGWVNGTLLKAGGSINVPDPSLPIYAYKGWCDWDSWGVTGSGEATLTTVLEANQKETIELAIAAFIRVDRAVATGTGWVGVWPGGDSYHQTYEPDLFCRITPLFE